MDPFAVMDCALIAIATGETAHNLREFLDLAQIEFDRFAALDLSIFKDLTPEEYAKNKSIWILWCKRFRLA